MPANHETVASSGCPSARTIWALDKPHRSCSEGHSCFPTRSHTPIRRWIEAQAPSPPRGGVEQRLHRIPLGRAEPCSAPYPGPSTQRQPPPSASTRRQRLADIRVARKRRDLSVTPAGTTTEPAVRVCQCSNGLPNDRALPPVAVVRPCRNKYTPTATNAKVTYPLACVSAALALVTPKRDSSRARSTSRNSSVKVPGRRRVKRVSNTITTSQEIRNISWVPFTAAASAGSAGLIPYQS